MDKKQRVIVALLIVAIVFSLISIFFSLNSSDIGREAVRVSGTGDGSVSLFVESRAGEAGQQGGVNEAG